MKYSLIVNLLILGIAFHSCGQERKDTLVIEGIIDTLPSVLEKGEKAIPSKWTSLSDGLYVQEIDAPKKSVVGDSKITIVKIDPRKFDFFLLTATELGKARSVKEWADTFNLNFVVNAGMYELSNGLINRGYMKNYNHINNSLVKPGYNSMIALNPKDSLQIPYTILDLECDSWDNVQDDYHCYAQGMRMIDCNGQALGWNKRKQSCSMLVAATDPAGNIYYVFSRSPYTHNDMIEFIKGFPYDLTNAIYIEGGPETSLYLKVGETVIEKVGSYVSDTYPNDKNNHFWNLPNVIGMRQKSGGSAN